MTDRTPDHPVADLFIDRWSPRAFDRSQLPEADLMTVLEAARWAPSAFNVQPWRFVYARRGDAAWQELVDLLSPFNRDWAQHASALVYLFSDRDIDGKDGKPGRANGTHVFDAGAAWAQAALQATALGYHCHGMGGFLKEEINDRLGVPERFRPQLAVAIGRRGDVSELSETLRERETPNGRKPLSEIAFPGTWR